MRAYTSLRRRADILRVSRRGRRSGSEFLACFMLDGRESTRITITISAQVGGAVVRNRLRRRLQALLDCYAFDRRPQRDVVFIARPGAAQLSFGELRSEVERSFGPPP